MMKLENLPKSKETKATKRVGRGPGSGMGKTSTRGQKGQHARSGSSISNQMHNLKNYSETEKRTT